MLTLEAPTALLTLDGESTLDEVIVGAWEGLAARRAVACPVCGASMQRIDAPAAYGRCQGCGATLQ